MFRDWGTSFAQTLSGLRATSPQTRHQTKASRTCCIWHYKQIQGQSKVNTRSLLIYLSWTLSHSHNCETTVSCPFPRDSWEWQRFTLLHFLRHRRCCKTALVPGVSLSHGARGANCPTRQWGSAAAPGKIGTVPQLSCLSEISIQCFTPYPLHLCQWRVKCGAAKPSALGTQSPQIISGGWTRLILALSYSNHEYQGIPAFQL